MSTQSSDPSASDLLKVRAWSAVTEDNLTVRAAARLLEISPATVSRYVREIAQTQDYIDLLNVAEVRVGQAVRCDEYIRLLRVRVEKEGKPIEQIAPHLLGFEKFIADLIGTRAPVWFNHHHTGSGQAGSGNRAMDPARAAAIEQAKQIVAAERAAIEARGDDDA